MHDIMLDVHVLIDPLRYIKKNLFCVMKYRRLYNIQTKSSR